MAVDIHSNFCHRVECFQASIRPLFDLICDRCGQSSVADGKLGLFGNLIRAMKTSRGTDVVAVCDF
jgi:hypothetical protein